MKKVKALVEASWFQNFIIIVIFVNAIVMGLQTSKVVEGVAHDVLFTIDLVCLVIFIVEIFLKFMAYGLKFFKSGWNIFDLIIVLVSVLSGLSALKVFRVFRMFRVVRSVKTLRALRGMRALRMVSGLKHLRLIVEAIGKSIPGIFWSGILLILIYYMFAIMGTSLFGAVFTDWFGTVGRSMYTLFQVMTLESWSMGISRPVMEVYGWAWMYFVPFVLITAFLVMNVVVGIVVNAISEVSALDSGSENKDENEEAKEEMLTDKQKLAVELEVLKKQIAKIEVMIKDIDEKELIQDAEQVDE